MPSKDPTVRMANYNAGFLDLTAVLCPIAQRSVERLKQTMAVKFEALYAMETEVKQTLDAEGVSIIQYPFYISFARELHSYKARQFSGESLAMIANLTLIPKWVARGLTQSVLEAIRSQNFDIGDVTPETPPEP